MMTFRSILVMALTVMVTLLSVIGCYGQVSYEAAEATTILRTSDYAENDLTDVESGITAAAVSLNVANRPPALPVQFSGLSAATKGGILFVYWSTTTEKNNKSFEIEVSANGINFTTIGTMDSKAENGNSNQPLNYEFTADLSGVAIAASGIAIAVLALATLDMRLPKKQRWLFAGIVLSCFLMGITSCQKKTKKPVSDNSNAYIRIAQIDQKGSKTYSTIVNVVNND